MSSSAPSVASEDDAKQVNVHASDRFFDPFTFMFTTTSAVEQKPRNQHWVLDSGATCCATYDETECIDIIPCNIKVTAAGSSFRVQHIGTALINTLDEGGHTVQLKMRNTLISPDFPYKLLALHMFTVKDWEVNITKSQMRIFNSVSSQTVFLGDKDPHTLLYFLHPASEASFLARSYGEPKGSNIDLLWQLHQRLGHRNFADIGRQYSIPVPKQVPACVSCIMGKSHKHPYLSEGFERATRVAEGFHSDFRGPFSVHTPQGHLYLLTLIDDLSDRIFGFLAKTQTEWHEIWPKFVLRVESEIGRPNCIAWLLSDNGGVYIAEKTTTFNSSKGIRQRLSAPYAQWMNHTAERNMRTIGEMAVTTLVHSNLPKSAWGYAVLLAIEVINRTADNAERNKQSGFPAHFSRLEKWKGKELPLQTKALYPLAVWPSSMFQQFCAQSWTNMQLQLCIWELIQSQALIYLALFTIWMCQLLWMSPLWRMCSHFANSSTVSLQLRFFGVLITISAKVILDLVCSAILIHLVCPKCLIVTR